MNSTRTYFITILSILAAYLVYSNVSLFTSIILLTCLCILYVVLQFRNELNFLPIYILVLLSCRKIKIVDSLSEIQKMMKLTDKGMALEDLVALPAWSPILSLESVSGEIWKELREKFMDFIKLLPDLNVLGEIASLESKDLLKSNIKIDGKQVSISTLKSLLKYVFTDIKENMINHDFINNTITEIEKSHNINFYETLYLSSLEYRKEIAVKGKGNTELKYKSVNLIIEILNKSKFKDLHDWKDPKCSSIVMQPFVISPMINMSDIAVQIKENLDKYETICKLNTSKSQDNMMFFINYSLLINHPFPLLERYDKDLNLHYFLNMSRMKEILDNSISDSEEKDYSIMNFGMGIRSCLGRHIAKTFLSNFFDKELIYSNSFIPNFNHLYSGRDNDNFSIYESIYTFMTFIKCIIMVIKNCK